MPFTKELYNTMKHGAEEDAFLTLSGGQLKDIVTELERLVESEKMLVQLDREYDRLHQFAIKLKDEIKQNQTT